MQNDTPINMLQTALAAGLAANAAFSVRTPIGTDGVPHVMVPDGYTVMDMEQTLPQPMRKRGHVALHSVESLIVYVNEHKGAGTRLFVDRNPLRPAFVAELNGHTPGSDNGAAGWGDHTANFTAPLSPEWVTWQSKNGVKMSQEDFARFIEQNVVDIVDPASGEMLQISRTLQAKTKVDFKSAVRLDNGEVKIAYLEEINGTAGIEGKLAIPEEFRLGIPVLVGGTVFNFPAKFRYKVGEGKLVIWYELVRPHKIMEAAIAAIVDAIQAPDAAGLAALPDDHPYKAGSVPLPEVGTGLRVLYGTP